MMTWDTTDHADLLTQPLLMMAGSKADSKYMTDEAFQKAVNAKDKEEYIIPGATHIRTYFVKEYVDKEHAKLKEFFSSRL